MRPEQFSSDTFGLGTAVFGEVSPGVGEWAILHRHDIALVAGLTRNSIV